MCKNKKVKNWKLNAFENSILVIEGGIRRRQCYYRLPPIHTVSNSMVTRKNNWFNWVWLTDMKMRDLLDFQVQIENFLSTDRAQRPTFTCPLSLIDSNYLIKNRFQIPKQNELQFKGGQHIPNKLIKRVYLWLCTSLNNGIQFFSVINP